MSGDEDITGERPPASREPKFFRPGELTDETLSPLQMRALARETKDDVEAIGRAVSRIGAKLDRVIDVVDRVVDLEARANKTDDRFDKSDTQRLELEQRVAHIEGVLGIRVGGP